MKDKSEKMNLSKWLNMKDKSEKMNLSKWPNMKDNSKKMNLSKWLSMKDNFQKESRMSVENESKLIEKKLADFNDKKSN